MQPALFLHSQTGKRKCQQLTTAHLRGIHQASRRVSVTDRSTGIQFLIDTGADVSVFPVSAKDKNGPFQCTLQAANKTPIMTYGEKSLTLNLGLRRTFRWIFISVQIF